MERTWGDFRYNLYIFSGIIFTIIAAFAMYFIARLGIQAEGVEYLMYSQTLGYRIALCVTTYYISASVFLAFAATYPESQVLLMFVIPVKVKWLGWAAAAMTVYELIVYPAADKMTLVFSLVPFLLFFWKDCYLQIKLWIRHIRFRLTTRR